MAHDQERNATDLSLQYFVNIDVGVHDVIKINVSFNWDMSV